MSKRTYISSKTWLQGFSSIETHCQERLTCFETCWEGLTCFGKYLKHVKDLYVSNMFGFEACKPFMTCFKTCKYFPKCFKHISKTFKSFLISFEHVSKHLGPY